ncbi:MAG: hypothetical protein ACRDVW_06655 [Acidimicrobiales bacterium]
MSWLSIPPARRRAGPLVVLGLAALFPLGSASPASAAVHLHPVVVQRVVQAFDGQSGEGVEGPRTLSVHLSQPTRRGDLLIAAVDDGVVTSGMVHPQYLLNHWNLAVTTIGGETAHNGTGPYRTGGLQASIYFLADNPGGIVQVPVARVPNGTQATVTITIAELSGVPASLAVNATGTSTSGPKVADYTQRSSVTSTTATSERPDLVVALFNNGGNSPEGERYVTQRGWTLIGEDTSPTNEDQPILANFEVAPHEGIVHEHERYLGGYPIDNCAVIVALVSS